MPGNTITLTEVALRGGEVLEVACTRCDRRGRYPVSTLIRRHGAAMDLPALLRLLSADCSVWKSVSPYDSCGAHFPELPALFSEGRS